MPVPDFQTIMLPLLRQYQDGKEHTLHELMEKLAEEFQLTDDDLSEMLPSGGQTIFYNRVGWARTYLAKSGLLEMVKRSIYKITERGKMILKQNPERIDMKYLERFPEYIEFRDLEGTRGKKGDNKGKEPKNGGIEQTPEEILESAYLEIRENLADDLLTLVKKSSPYFFEQLVVELLVKMGYGGSRQDAARAVGRSGDEGIDGIIDEDRLGLDSIYIQAKRWESGVVSRPEIQKFVGALMGKRARKGIFITTSSFSNEALNYVANIDTKVVLIDGKKLAEFMIDYDVGVTSSAKYELKKIDSDYFSGG